MDRQKASAPADNPGRPKRDGESAPQGASSWAQDEASGHPGLPASHVGRRQVRPADGLHAHAAQVHQVVEEVILPLFHVECGQAYILYQKHHIAAGQRKSPLKNFMTTLASELSQRFHSMPTDLTLLLPNDVPINPDAALGPYPVRQDLIGN